MKKLREMVTNYLLEVILAGFLAGCGLVISVQVVNAEQTEKLRGQEEQIRLLRIENREDHKAIETRLDTLLRRGSP